MAYIRIKPIDVIWGIGILSFFFAMIFAYPEEAFSWVFIVNSSVIAGVVALGVSLRLGKSWKGMIGFVSFGVLGGLGVSGLIVMAIDFVSSIFGLS